MIPGVVSHVGQAVVQASRAMASTAASPFLALIAESQPASQTPLQETTGVSEDRAEFSALYSEFEKLVGNFLENFPALPSLRVEIAPGGKLKVGFMNDATLQDSEIAGRITDLETQLNADHQLVEVADRLQQGKSQQAWRDGLPHHNVTVQFVFNR